MKRLDNATFIDKNWVERFRQPVSAYGRVMWYIRWRTTINQDVNWWDIVTEENKYKKIHSNWFNMWKMSEWADRKFFTLWHTCPRNFDKISAMLQDNKDFIAKYMKYETA